MACSPLNRGIAITPDTVIACIPSNCIQTCTANQNIIEYIALKIVIALAAIQDIILIPTKKTRSVSVVPTPATILVIISAVAVIKIAYNIAGNQRIVTVAAIGKVGIRNTVVAAFT